VDPGELGGDSEFEQIRRAARVAAVEVPDVLIGRFSVYPNPDGDGYLLDVPAEVMRHLNTRVVIPLIAVAAAPKPATRLNPIFVIDDIEHSLVTQFMAAIPADLLKREVTNAAERRAEIVNAIDLLLQGS
jgi:toxin CcdB